MQKKYKTNLDVFFKSLDKKRCYTFGFKHESMHPFREGADTPINKMWFIQSVNLSTNAVAYEMPTGNFGIPNQKKYSFPKDAPKSTKTLFPILHGCLESYLNTTKPNSVNYGFILRSKNPEKTGLYTHIILESSLMQKIRQLYYNSSLNNQANEMEYDREKYTIIYSYLDPNINMLFIKLFPQYTDMYDQLNNITTNLIKSILSYAKNKDAEKNHMAQFLYEQINLQCKIDLSNRHVNKIISSYLLNTTFVDIYYSLFVDIPQIESIKIT